MKSPLRMMESARRSARESKWGTPNTAGVSIPHELSFVSLGHQFADARILDDVSLTAQSGTVTCLLGPSGSGKTTLLRLAAGMDAPTDGQVLMDGQEISGPSQIVPPDQRGVGLVFQDYALFPHMSNLDNVKFGLKHMQRGLRDEQARKMLDRVGLLDRATDYPHHLSGGEQQRVALARALAPRPGVLLMDEPFSGLDARLRDTMRDETLAILRETRATSIIVTHDPEEALRMADQIVLLREGRVQQAGTARDLYFRPANLFVAGFFSELNIFTGQVNAGRVETPLGPVPLNGVSDGSAANGVFRVNALDVQETDKGFATGRVLSSRFTGDNDHLVIGISGCEQPVRARIKAGLLSSKALAGQTPVSVEPEIAGSFAFTLSEDS